MKIQDTVRAAVEEARFSQVVGKMQEAKAAQMDTHDVPAVVKLASKEFHITDSESTGVLQRLIESNDLTLYGLSNAVTRRGKFNIIKVIAPSAEIASAEGAVIMIYRYF